MRKIRYAALAVLVLFFCILPSYASQQLNIISSQGIIEQNIPEPTPSPTPTPVPTPKGENFGAIPEAWHIGQEGSVLDYDVLSPSGNPTIRFGDGYTSRTSDSHNLNEVNTGFIPVRPGDRIYFSCWIKSELSIGDGSNIGFDVYGSTQRLWEVSDHASGNDNNCFNTPKDWDYNSVPNGAGWTQLVVDIIVPYTDFYYNDYGTIRDPAPQKICGFIAWLTPSWGSGETNRVWFGDAEIYVNP
jgi:hypothetical protein